MYYHEGFQLMTISINFFPLLINRSVLNIYIQYKIMTEASKSQGYLTNVAMEDGQQTINSI